MKIHRFFVKQNLDGENLTVDDKETTHQVENVLKMRPGEKIILFNGDGYDYFGEIEAVEKKVLRLRNIKKEINRNLSVNQVRLYCAILKKENFELAVQKATEVGVSEIIPLITGRTVKFNINISRLQKIVKEAAEQSGRNKPPVLHSPVDFKKALGELDSGDINLYFDILGEEKRSGVVKNKAVNVFIGPEGGWSREERILFESKNVQSVTLGQGVLRAETAAVVAAYLMAN